VRGTGKISSILEVGTGFHHELTGRENIYTSGYTLGMNREEIKRKFDEIVSFSGIEKFLDTPVKRYSSGMYVRLAFAVAAHLEPDILIVDEVLAVGDADFQKKCMSKMHQVSDKDGRTILFVSHNLPAIANLCSKAIWLNKGKLEKIDSAPITVNTYLASTKQEKTKYTWESMETAPGNEFIRMKSARFRPQTDEPDAFITVETPIQLDFEFWCFLDNCNLNVNIKLLTGVGECVFNLGTSNIKAEKAVLGLTSIIPGNLLNNATYSISLTVIKNNSSTIYEFSNCLGFEVEDVRKGISYFGKWQGIIRPQIDSYLYVKDILEYKQS
jgi:lipopolysaccharide transport system ATP-binding protein